VLPSETYLAKALQELQMREHLERQLHLFSQGFARAADARAPLQGLQMQEHCERKLHQLNLAMATTTLQLMRSGKWGVTLKLPGKLTSARDWREH
jgi:hypothetical protein